MEELKVPTWSVSFQNGYLCFAGSFSVVSSRTSFSTGAFYGRFHTSTRLGPGQSHRGPASRRNRALKPGAAQKQTFWRVALGPLGVIYSPQGAKARRENQHGRVQGLAGRGFGWGFAHVGPASRYGPAPFFGLLDEQDLASHEHSSTHVDLGVAGPVSSASRSRASSRVPVEWAESISEATSLSCS